MRTTLSLDDDVAALLKRAMKRNGTSLKEQVNAALRVGLVAQPAPARRRQVTRSFDGGAPVISLDSISDALALAEGEGHR